MQNSNAVVKKIYCVVVNGEVQEKLDFDNIEIAKDYIKLSRKYDCCGFYDGLKAGYQRAADRLDTMPTVEERDKGYWIDIDLDTSICSVCRNPQEDETKYCPECGAKMDGDNNGK